MKKFVTLNEYINAHTSSPRISLKNYPRLESIWTK